MQNQSIGANIKRQIVMKRGVHGSLDPRFWNFVKCFTYESHDGMVEKSSNLDWTQIWDVSRDNFPFLWQCGVKNSHFYRCQRSAIESWQMIRVIWNLNCRLLLVFLITYLVSVLMLQIGVKISYFTTYPLLLNFTYLKFTSKYLYLYVYLILKRSRKVEVSWVSI